MNKIYILFFLLFFIGLASAVPIDNQYHVNWRVAGGNVSDYIFEFSDSSNGDCSSVIYSNTSRPLTANSVGDLSYYLPNINTSLGNLQIQLCIYQGTTLIENNSVALAPYCVFSLGSASNSTTITLSNITDLYNFTNIASHPLIPWTNDSRVTYIKPGYPQNINISGNITINDTENYLNFRVSDTLMTSLYHSSAFPNNFIIESGSPSGEMTTITFRPRLEYI